ncbi:hypothetical protein [Microbispora bryophytorum]|uniref:Transposase n=1 Tax=Microbispora bryophytorum subsp. camponoti TaxID=1677852 RepID=A0ABR8L3V4_9ACTN|nr:hypothetical protein [Microbispora camponoti]MBD3144377.1 hypothetical protein [Microbispora camponoti]
MHSGTGKYPRVIEEFAGYLRQRWEQGCTNAEQVYQEIKTMGYCGKATLVRQPVRPVEVQDHHRLPPSPATHRLPGHRMVPPPPRHPRKRRAPASADLGC